MNRAKIHEIAHYKHRATITRFGTSETDYGETVFSEVIIATNIKCTVSQSSRNGFNTVQTTTVNNIKYPVKMLCNTSIDVIAGDKITVTYENGLTRKYQAGEPFIYSDHLEVPLLMDGES